MRARTCLVALVLLAGCDGPADPDAGASLDGRAVTDAGDDAGVDAGPPPVWWALDGTDPTLATDDLAPFDALLDGVEVVGIGESVHTTGGEIRMRARLIRYLVSELGFRVVAVENPRILTEGTVPFVERCEGTAEEAAQLIDPIWWDRSTPALLQWLCDYNRDHASDPVRVVGVDIREPWDGFREVEAFLSANAAADATGLLDGMRTCLGVGFADRIAFFEDATVQSYYAGAAPTPEADAMACATGTDAAIAYLAANRDALVAASSAREVELARLDALAMAAFDETLYYLSRNDLPHANPPRDAAMAEIFATLRRLDFPGARTILFAHDGHIMSASDEVLAGQWRGVRNLTTILQEDLGDRYAAIGQISRTTHIDWQMGMQTLEHTDDSDLEQVLEALGPDFVLVDTSAAVAAAPPLWDPTLGYHVGFDTLVPATHYRAIVWHRESPAADWFTPPPFAM